MTESSGRPPCPGCGATVDTQYCPHCGSRTLPADEPVWSGRAAAASADAAPSADEAPTMPSLPVVPRADGPAAAVPEMFPTELVPTIAGRTEQAWSQSPEPAPGADSAPAGLFPGWTGMQPPVPSPGAPGALAPRPERRRKAIYAIAGIAGATVLVLLAALLIAPPWGGANETADKIGRPVAVSSAPVTSAAVPPPAGAPTGSGASAATTVTVTAPPPGTARATAALPPARPPTPTPKPVTTTPASKKPAPVSPLGVPQREITCSSGYIVQLASELDQPTFAAHVARLKAAGQLPGGALAADSTHSCRIFTSQRNTLVLYAGPFGSRYAGCAARLAGPADAYIKGGNPGTATEFISCLCPARATELPTVAHLGQRDVWVGELQRVLGARLNIEIAGLDGSWGVFTAGAKAAVQKFQRQHHLPVNGVVDARTWKVLQAAGC